MTPRAPSIRCRVDPRCVGPDKAARRLGLTQAEFEGARQRLEAAGFPRPLPAIERYDLAAIDRWLDGFLPDADNGARNAGSVVAGRIEALRHGNRQA